MENGCRKKKKITSENKTCYPDKNRKEESKFNHTHSEQSKNFKLKYKKKRYYPFK